MKDLTLNNEKTKQWKLYIVTISFKALAFVLNLFRSNKITHLFFYSEEQANICGLFTPIMPQKKETYIGKKRYTEMREIGKGYSNWGDAKIVGFGGYGDVRLGK